MNVWKNFVLVIVFLGVASETKFQQGQQRFRGQDGGKLLRVVPNQSDPTNSKIFYYVPASLDISGEMKQKKQEIPQIMTDSEFVENTMKLAMETEKTKMESKERLQAENTGTYYIYHPNGVLQRIEYETRNDDDETVSTRVRYKVVEPIKGPIYTYDPETLLYRQI